MHQLLSRHCSMLMSFSILFSLNNI